MIGPGQNKGNIIFSPTDAVYQALSENGDGTGNISHNVDGSGTPVKFFIQPPANERYILQRMTLQGIDSNWNNALLYAAIAELPNGIRVYIENDSGLIKDYTRDFTIKRTHHWGLLAGVDSVVPGGTVADPLLVRWTFNAGATNITLNGANTERFVVEINDLLTGLSEQIAVVQGGRRFLS